MSDLTANLTPENIRDPFRKLLIRVDLLSLQGRSFLANLSELKDSLEAVNGAIEVAARMEDNTEEETANDAS